MQLPCDGPLTVSKIVQSVGRECEVMKLNNANVLEVLIFLIYAKGKGGDGGCSKSIVSGQVLCFWFTLFFVSGRCLQLMLHNNVRVLSTRWVSGKPTGTGGAAARMAVRTGSQAVQVAGWLGS